MVELMIVLVIAALLLTLATPSYRQFIGRAHRSDAVSRMLQTAGCQERLRTTEGNYRRDRCLPADQPRYSFAYTEQAGSGFTLLAQPLGGQLADPCGTLILEHTGRRDVSALGINAQRCWSGR